MSPSLAPPPPPHAPGWLTRWSMTHEETEYVGSAARDRRDFRKAGRKLTALLEQTSVLHDMGTPLYYVTGLLFILMAGPSSSQTTSFRENLEIQGKERFNFFDMELLKSLASSEKGNLLLSPASVKAALAMVLEGAGGKSAREIEEALRVADDEKATRIQFRNFLNSLQVNIPGTKVETANQIFLSQTITPHAQYETMLKTYYLSNIERVDFSRPAYAAQTINRWVNMLTHGLIPTLVEPGSLSTNTQLMLANAMYFKGKWKNAFDYDKTTVQCFYDENSCLDTYLMESVNFYKFAFIPSLNAHAVELPYEGDKFSLLLLLPLKVNGIEQLVRDLTHISLHTIVSSLRPTEVLVSVPRFKIDFDTDLIQKLQELGVQEIFSPNANLTGMVQSGSPDLHISNVLHKAKIEVTEEGTEAAAATGTLVVPLMGTSLPKLIFNHPFLFFLRNVETGDILFAGRLSEPEAAPPQNSNVSSNLPSALPPRVGINQGVPNGSTTNISSFVANSSKPGDIYMVNSSKPVASQSNPSNYFFQSRNLNNEAPSVRNMPTAQSHVYEGNQPQPNVVQYQPNVSRGMYRGVENIPYTGVTSAQFVPAPTQQNVAQFITKNINAAQYKPPSNGAPQIAVGENTNQSYNDRIHFS